MKSVLIAGIGGGSLGTEIAKSLRLAGAYRILGCDVSPLAFVRMTLLGPWAAPGSTVTLIVICTPPVATGLLRLIPLPVTATFVPAVKPVPTRNSPVVAPRGTAAVAA